MQEAHFTMSKTLPIPHLKQPSTAIITLNLEAKLIKWHKAMVMLITLQQGHPRIIKVFIGVKQPLVITVFMASINITIHMTLTQSWNTISQASGIHGEQS